MCPKKLESVIKIAMKVSLELLEKLNLPRKIPSFFTAMAISTFDHYLEHLSKKEFLRSSHKSKTQLIPTPKKSFRRGFRSSQEVSECSRSEELLKLKSEK